MRLLVLLVFVACVTAVPIHPHGVVSRQQVPPDVVPDAELLPTGPSPPPTSPPPPPPPPAPVTVPPVTPPAPPATPTSPAPPVSASPNPSPPGTGPGTGTGSTPTGPAGASPSPSPIDDSTTGSAPVGLPGVAPAIPDGSGQDDEFGEQTEEPEPSPDGIIEGGGSNRAALAGGLTGGIFALLLLLCCCCVIIGRKKKKKQREDLDTGAYATTTTGVGTADAQPSVEPAPIPGALDKDVARDAGPAAGLAAGATGAIGAAGLAGIGAGAVTATDESSEEVITRGPTPPQHDYILGAGPATTRKDFVDLRTKFERDEIGDNSAVLGVERSGVVGEGLEHDIAPVGQPGSATSGMRESPVLPEEGLDVEKRESKTTEGLLPDRGGPVGMTFDSQERLMVGGDGSGAISDAAMSLNASIAEESGDVPSLERDPILRERDQTF